MAKTPLITWPLVALSAIGGAFILLVLVVIPKDDTQTRSAILGTLLTVSTMVVTAYVKNKTGNIQDSVDQVNDKVNGRMTQLIDETAKSRDALVLAHADVARYKLLLEQAASRVVGETTRELPHD